MGLVTSFVLTYALAGICSTYHIILYSAALYPVTQNTGENKTVGETMQGSKGGKSKLKTESRGGVLKEGQQN